MFWQYLYPSWTPPLQADIQSIMDSLKITLKEPFFMELIMLTAWFIWSSGLPGMISSSRASPVYRDAGKKLRMISSSRKSYGGLRNWVEGFHSYFLFSPFLGLGRVDSFFVANLFLETQYTRRCSETHAYTHPYERAHANPTHMSTFGRRLAANGNIASDWMIMSPLWDT
jgi:hypothetical protein